MTVDSDAETLPAATRLGRVALRVADLDAVTEFYRTVVGLELLERCDDRATLGAGEAPLCVLEATPDAPARDQDGAGLYHTAFRVPSRAALGDALERIQARSRLDGASDHHVSEALYLTDPEGNGIEIYRDRPRAEWPRADDGRVRMGTDPLDHEAVAAAAAGEAGVPPATDVGHIHLEVTDLETARDFYVDTFGFDLQMTVPRAWFASAGGYHHHVGANTWNNRTVPARGRGLSWVEILLPDAAAVGTLRERLLAHGFAATDRGEGFAVTDPDGIELRVRPDPT